MMTSQILKSASFTKTQKSRYLENETLFFLQIKKYINYTSRAACFMTKNSFVAEVTFKAPLTSKEHCHPNFMTCLYFPLVSIICNDIHCQLLQLFTSKES